MISYKRPTDSTTGITSGQTRGYEWPEEYYKQINEWTDEYYESKDEYYEWSHEYYEWVNEYCEYNEWSSMSCE